VANGAASAAADLIPVAVHGWSPSSYGIWGILLVQLIAITTYAIRRGPDYIREWAGARKQGAETEREDRAAKAAETLRLETAEAAAKKEITDRLNAMEDRIARMSQAMSFMMNAAVTSTNALEAVAPGTAAVKQSRDLIAFAASALGNEDPFSRALAQLAQTKGVGE
jgi:hypothetical protein